ncbi:MAG: (E)-4-hydroxy-3-methylbut-2-enyl-diphosphate synthase [Treponema sp.]|nr:(E)-4-hydroxy-3-methylbut-2-enyl-diphosphate synthase [Treponema sp.]
MVTVGGFAHVKAVRIGGDSPVVIQTMWKDRLSFSDLEGQAGEALVARIQTLGQMGCGLLRFAVPDLSAAEVLGRLAGMVSMPLVADIHFDYKIALRCMDFPIAKIRINPGNIGSKEKVRAVLEKAGEKGIPIRIGVNAGSLPKKGTGDWGLGTGERCSKYDGTSDRSSDSSNYGHISELHPNNSIRPPQSPVPSPQSLLLVEAAERELAIFDEFNFTNVLVSMKASGIADTIRANRIFAERHSGYCVPLHIGVTEAGPLVAGVARSSIALASLLADGIGDTVRVSLSDSMENEVIAAREICNAAAEMAGDGAAAVAAANRLRRSGVTIISCPRCGRHGFDTHGFSGRWLPRLYALDRDISIAIMGCEVNGPEEARQADLGITGAGNKVLLFRRGTVVRTVSAEEADEAFAKELDLI